MSATVWARESSIAARFLGAQWRGDDFLRRSDKIEA